MPRESPFKVKLTSHEARELKVRAGKYTLPYFQVQRAKMILMAAEGYSNAEIAHYLHTSRDVVSKWRKRFFEKRLPGLGDLERSGRPRAFPPRAHGAG